MPLQQHLATKEPSTKEARRLEGLLIGMGASLEKKYSSYKAQRDEKEREWIGAVRQYEGQYDQDDLTKIEKALSATGNREDPISVNITRPKTNIAIARMKDIQFPTGGDFNFFLRPSPLTQQLKEALKTEKPDGAMQMQAAQAGMPLDKLPQPAALAQETVDKNKRSAPEMERALRRRLVEAEYGRKARLAIEDLCILGSAVLKGPTIQNKKYNTYADAQSSDGKPLQLLEEQWKPTPSVQRVDPRLFFPDPSARLPDEIEDSFEDHPFSASEVRALAKNPSFMKDKIKEVLDRDPDNTDAPTIVQETQNDRGQTSKARYWIHEYHGPLDKAVLYDAEMISEEDNENPLSVYTGEVWFANKIIIRLSLSHIEGEEGIPYSVTTWEKDPNSVFGHGVPYLLRNAARTVNNAYLMLLDNASLTSGPQIVLNKEMIEPASADDDYTIRPMKAWFLTEYGQDVREAMQFINIPAQMEPISKIIDSAMQFADIESSTPLLQQGDIPVGNNTTTGIAMVMSATNIVQKAASMSWDDNITKPMMKRWYHFEMQYGEDNDVKGDFDIEVGGATERIEAEIRSQEIERMLGLASSNEEFMEIVNSAKAFRALVDNTRTGDVLRTEEEVATVKQEKEQAAAAQQQQDPEMLKAQAALLMAQARQQEVQANAQLANAKQETAVMEIQARYQGFVAEAEARQNEATLKYELGLAQIAATREITVAQLKTSLQISDNDRATKLHLKEIDFSKMEREIQVKEEFGSGI